MRTESSDPYIRGKERTVAALLYKNRVRLGFAVGAFLILCWSTIQGLIEYWLIDPDFSHGFLVPVICALLVYSKRAELGALPASPSTWGLSLFCFCLVVFFLGHVTLTNTLERLGMWGMLVGWIWFLLGTRFLFTMPFPYLYLLFCIPPPYFLLQPVRSILKAFATRASADLLGILGIVASPEGNILSIGARDLEVADTCSGIRSLIAIVATAALFAYVLRTGYGKGAILVLTAVPITIAVNVLRIAMVATALVRFDLDLTRGLPHEVVGLLVFGVSILLLYGSWQAYGWLFRWKPMDVRV